jgi:hypothetical protein
LGDTPWSVALHESLWAYPIVESVHVLTLCLFLGLAVMLDLRLLGVSFTRMPVSQISRRLLPFTMTGFAVMVISGSLLFYAIPVKTYLNIFFRIKVATLIMAGINAAVFHSTMEKHMSQWENDVKPPLRARWAGGLSLFFWAVIVVAGRLIAYNWWEDPSLH